MSGSAVADMQGRQKTLDAQIAALPPVSNDTEDYAAQTRGRLGAPPSDVPAANASDLTEAEARALRERATPPPQAKH